MFRPFVLPVAFLIATARLTSAQTTTVVPAHHQMPDSTVHMGMMAEAHAALHEWLMGTWLGQAMMEHHAAMHGGAAADSLRTAQITKPQTPCAARSATTKGASLSTSATKSDSSETCAPGHTSTTTAVVKR